MAKKKAFPAPIDLDSDPILTWPVIWRNKIFEKLIPIGWVLLALCYYTTPYFLARWKAFGFFIPAFGQLRFQAVLHHARGFAVFAWLATLSFCAGRTLLDRFRFRFHNRLEACTSPRS